MRFLAGVLFLLSGPAAATTIVIDFTSPDPGEYETLAYPEVVLSEWTANRGLGISTPGGGPPVLRVGDQGGTLLLTFLAPVIGVELTFGGDSASSSVTAGPATLVGIGGGSFVGITSVIPNRNGLIDQTLSIRTTNVMDSALFHFRQLGEHQPLSPLVGRITLTTVEVPEPGPLLLGAVLAVACAIRPGASDPR
jgi:hypothetical protein